MYIVDTEMYEWQDTIIDIGPMEVIDFHTINFTECRMNVSTVNRVWYLSNLCIESEKNYEYREVNLFVYM